MIYRHLSRLDAEREMVAAAAEYERGLRIANVLRLSGQFRLYFGADEQIALLVSWRKDGSYDRYGNAERLGLPDDLVCLWGSSDDYLVGLASAIVEANRLEDAAINAHRAQLDDYPFARVQVPPPPARKPPPRGDTPIKEGGRYGGVRID
jgi:hypothetical protein